MKDPIKNAQKTVVKKPPSPAILKHGAQIDKLHQKFTLETALLDDIRNFLRQKASLEKDCALAISKLVTQFSNKKDFLNYWDAFHGSPPTSTTDTRKLDQEENTANQTNQPITLAQFWKRGLAEIQKQQSSKVEICDEVLKTVEEMKAPKAARIQQFKQAIEVAVDIQSEINTVVDMVYQSKKVYSDSEKIVQEMQTKIRKIEEKSKRHPKGAKVPEKITETLQNVAPKATAARNEYMLSVTGCNAHLSRYYTHDLFYVTDLINGNTYDHTKSVLNAVFATEHRIVPENHKTYETLLANIDRLSSRRDIESFFTANPVLSESVAFNFEPIPGDTNTILTLNKDLAIISDLAMDKLAMDKCARKWAMRSVENDLAQNKLVQQLEILTSQAEEITTTEGKSAMDSKVFGLRESLRRAATFQQKAEAILQLLKQSGVNIENWLESARVAVEQKKNASDGPEIISTLPPKPIKHRRPSVRSEKVETTINPPSDAIIIENNSEEQARCVALYDYAAGRPDEITLTAEQELLVVSGSSDEEWLLVENSDGVQGYVPSNYVQILTADDNAFPPSSSYYPEEQTSENWPGENTQTNWSTDSVSGWAVEESPSWTHGYSYSSENPYNSANGNSEANESITDNENAHFVSENNTGGHDYCRALYDREAEDPEELSFYEGDIIRIISRCSGDVDDGYWTGELKGKTGVFLSLLTEEVPESDFTSDVGTSISSTPSPQPLNTSTNAADFMPPPQIPPRPRGF